LRTPTDKTTSRPVRPIDADPVRPDLPGTGQQSPAEAIAEAAIDLGRVEIEDPDQAPGSSRWFRRAPDESPVQTDARWLVEVYRGDEPQLTPRAILTGMLIGSVLAISNLYVGLKAGWALGVAITACVMSAAIWRGLYRIGLAKDSIRTLEQNCMQSTASAAGYTTSAALVTAVPAYMLITGVRISPIWLVLWTFFTSLLGLCIFVGVKRQLLHYERLAWPSSVAAAQTLRSLHERGRDAVDQARWLFGAASVAATIRFAIGNTFAWWKLPHWPEVVLLPGTCVRPVLLGGCHSRTARERLDARRFGRGVARAHPGPPRFRSAARRAVPERHDGLRGLDRGFADGVRRGDEPGPGTRCARARIAKPDAHARAAKP
jgi:hypothetical protein